MEDATDTAAREDPLVVREREERRDINCQTHGMLSLIDVGGDHIIFQYLQFHRIVIQGAHIIS